MLKKPLGVIIIILVAIFILKLRGKIKGNDVGRQVLFVGDIYTKIKFGIFLFFLFIIFFILSAMKSHKRIEKR